MEKHSLPFPTNVRSSRPSHRPTVLLGILFTLATVINFGPTLKDTAHKCLSNHLENTFPEPKYDEMWLKEHAQCPNQPKALYPKLRWNMTDDDKRASIQRVSAAVRIPTQSFDDNGEPNEDPRWAPFFDFQEWLKTTFPLAHEKATVEYINTLGIVATFIGSDSSLKPLLLMSHYDVVPAPSATYDRWTHAPFSGYIDEEFVWGRGAADDKTLLVAQWEAVTHLLENGFEPHRTLILSHGFDEEEVFARRGQGHIAPFLEERYGKDGLFMVIDEGGGTDDDYYGAPFALPVMGEKGYMDIVMSVGTAGGHSSVPPEHTGIGIMSQIVSALEDHPFPTKLTPSSPLLTSLMCASEHGDLPKKWSKLLSSEGPNSYPRLAKLFSSESRSNRAMSGTTTAVDIINGGVKVNALPELVTANVNFRIDFAESVESTKKHVAHLLGAVAKKNGLTFSAFEGKDGEKDLGGRYVMVELMGLTIEPAPRTPSNGPVWDLFAGTVKAVLPGPDGSERFVTPHISTGNTDCKVYYNLTRNVYRFMGDSNFPEANVHTVDEKALIDAHFEIVGWIHAIVQNADAYNGPE